MSSVAGMAHDPLGQGSLNISDVSKWTICLFVDGICTFTFKVSVKSEVYCSVTVITKKIQ